MAGFRSSSTGGVTGRTLQMKSPTLNGFVGPVWVRTGPDFGRKLVILARMTALYPVCASFRPVGPCVIVIDSSLEHRCIVFLRGRVSKQRRPESEQSLNSFPILCINNGS